MIDNIWDPQSVDCFACSHNAHSSHFNFRFWNPRTEAVDAFTCDWSGEVNWMCPHLTYLISRTIRHALNTEACSTLVVPNWPSFPPFWPMLFPTMRTVDPFVADRACDNSSSNLFNGPDMLALKIVPPSKQGSKL